MPSTELAMEQLRRIVELFSSEDLPETFRKAYLVPADVPCSRWSMNNRFLMLMEGTRDARGYRQWRSAGRQVRRGARAIYILGPRTRRIREDDEERIVLIGFGCIPVYRIEDTDGDPVRYVEDEPEPPPLQDVAERWGVSVRYMPSRHGEYGSFDPSSDEIVLSTREHDTFWHELAHKAHSMMEELKPVQDPEQEAIAQLSACVLAGLYGEDATHYTYSYIKAYADGKSPEDVGRMCCRVLAKTEQVLAMICDASSGCGDDPPGMRE